VSEVPQDKTSQSRLKHWLFDWAETILVAFILALIIRAFFVQVFWIPSGSMEPTLEINDRIVVNKVVYHFREPERQEVVVFRQVAPEGGPKRDIIKRVMGLPGEEFEIKDGIVYINGNAVDEKHPMNRDFADFGPIVVPPEAYFVMGDNRPASADSRYWGFLPRENLIGPAFIRIWPLTKFSLIP
jgi:signal peptidase I